MNYQDNLLISNLFDIYGELLTNNQKDVFFDYYFNNLSLSEIAENKNISRQAVDFTLKSAISSLNNFEEKLKFKSKQDFIISELDSISNNFNNLELKNAIDELIVKFKE